MSSPPLIPPPSPCRGVCILQEDGVCRGCQRTSLEINRWPLATPAEKLAIWQRLLHLPDDWNCSVCSQCATVFGCGNSDSCWCMDLPRRPLPDTASASCLCPSCLGMALDK